MQANMHLSINFYKLIEEQNLINSIYLICEKIMEKGEKAILYCNTKENLAYLDEKLWTFSQSEFIPHMTKDSEEFEEFKDEVPILLTDTGENMINAENLIILKPLEDYTLLSNFSKVFFLFSSEDKEQLTEARQFWKSLSQLKNYQCKFYEQNKDNKWELRS